MKAVRIGVVVCMTYVGLVVIVEALIGYLQPDMPGAVTLVTTGSDGHTSSRVLAGFRMDNSLYVAANHWPRDWYNRAVANPTIDLISAGERLPYTAVAVYGAERDRLAQAYDLEFLIRFLTGFPPRRFLRLDPVAPASPQLN